MKSRLQVKITSENVRTELYPNGLLSRSNSNSRRRSRLAVPTTAALAVIALGVGVIAAGSAAAATASPTDRCDGAAVSQRISVSTASELTSALANAKPGDHIVLAPGTYDGDFTDTHSGTAADRVTICGPSTAVLDGGTIEQGYTLHLDGAAYTTVTGLTVTHGLKGIMADHWDHGVINGVTVTDIGQEAIHLREFSSDDIVEHSTVSNTGLASASKSVHYGEGIYIGSAYENWSTYTNGKPDRCDNDRIIDNVISHTTAESVDIKEGTSDGTLRGNHFDGVGMVDPDGADSWVDVKGNDWTISGNVGVNSPRDGFQVHVKVPGWGRGTVFSDNTVTLGQRGYGFDILSDGTDTIVRCNNHVNGPDIAAANESLRCAAGRGPKHLPPTVSPKSSSSSSGAGHHGEGHHRGGLTQIIEVGVAVLVLAVMLVAWWWRRRRRPVAG
jgi:hypothetical protein